MTDSGGPRLRVLIAEDQYLMREGTRRLLAEVPGIDVVGEASDYDSVLAETRRLKPDVVLMDIKMLPHIPFWERGNWSQPSATVFACLSRFRGCSICHRLPPIATALLHKCSIPCRPSRQHTAECRRTSTPSLLGRGSAAARPRDRFCRRR